MVRDATPWSAAARRRFVTNGIRESKLLLLPFITKRRRAGSTPNLSPTTYIGGSSSLRPGAGASNFCNFSTTISFASSMLAEFFMSADEAPILTEYVPGSAIQEDLDVSNDARS
jgi:hypothetical protein